MLFLIIQRARGWEEQHEGPRGTWNSSGNWTFKMASLLINENITPEDPEQPEERTWIGEGVEGRKRERSGTADEGVDGG